MTADDALFVSLISDKQEVFVITLYCDCKHGIFMQSVSHNI